MNTHIYIGQSPFADFKKESILTKLKIAFPSIESFDAKFVYFLKTNETDNFLKIGNILNAKKVINLDNSSFLVAPRAGIFSPFSSKTLDIFKKANCKMNTIIRAISYQINSKNQVDLDKVANLLLDPMLEQKKTESQLIELLDQIPKQKNFQIIKNTVENLKNYSVEFGLWLSDIELDFLHQQYKKIDKDPSDVELYMFAQANSEHCRHKIFNANWTIDSKKEDKSLFDFIKNTAIKAPKNVISAYKDNAAIFKGFKSQQLVVNSSKKYIKQEYQNNILCKVETHNHPTAIEPYNGAATGAGGEIRDEGATGIGAKPKAALCGFCVSNLDFYDENIFSKPSHIASAKDIMINAPLGAADYNNEFGRANIIGFFRSFLHKVDDDFAYGYHKPIMLAGGVGNIKKSNCKKKELSSGDLIIVLGGACLNIGLGGGAASSKQGTAKNVELDFASVQRADPQMQRRAQELISYFATSENNPILFMHDVGAGGLSNALTELVKDANKGATFYLREILSADKTMSPLEIWCNESQERYVLAIKKEDLEFFEQIAIRENAPFSVVGKIEDERQLKLYDATFNNYPIDIPMNLLFGSLPKLKIDISSSKDNLQNLNLKDLTLDVAIKNVLQDPSVGEKDFLITIGDRSVGGLIARDQMVGPWQVPVSDNAIVLNSYDSYFGEVMAIGERPEVAIVCPKSSVALALGEAITNISSAFVEDFSSIKLSANWMSATTISKEAKKLFEGVKHLGMKLCPDLDLCIPVGKDSMSMQTTWLEKQKTKNVVSPLSLILTAFATTKDATKHKTPLLDLAIKDIYFLDLANDKDRLGASVLAKTINQIGSEVPDINSTTDLRNYFYFFQELLKKNLLVSYHDKSDGGLITCLLEMAFCSNGSLELNIPKEKSNNIFKFLFNEELGASFQIKNEKQKEFQEILTKYNLAKNCLKIAKITNDQNFKIQSNNEIIYQENIKKLRLLWANTSTNIRNIRDNPLCVKDELEHKKNAKDPGIFEDLSFSLPNKKIFITKTKKAPKALILKEQGINSHQEMANSFMEVGFDAYDLHLNDFLQKDIDLKEFDLIAISGGFSYGDVLGAGNGFAKAILFNDKLKDKFANFFNDPQKLTLGVCNGAQVLTGLKDIINGASLWPNLTFNDSRRFEARFSMVKIAKNNSIFFQNMQNSCLPIVVSHGEGKAVFTQNTTKSDFIKNNLACLNFVDNFGNITQKYPQNPNGSEDGICGFSNIDGTILSLMPHPERIIKRVNNSYLPKKNSPYSGWIKIFLNAKEYIV